MWGHRDVMCDSGIAHSSQSLDPEQAGWAGAPEFTWATPTGFRDSHGTEVPVGVCGCPP
eukprot:SAG25_NODE_84_length_16553_cov_5.346238_11_plen_59_part_00